jgi:two-component system OmpR family response regulator
MVAQTNRGKSTAVRILLVEDDPRICALTARGLSEHGFDVDELAYGGAVLSRLQGADYECLVLDLMLPDIDGLSVLKGIRGAGIDAPVILLTARNELEDRLVGLELGADDYVGKPFFVEELAARINAVRRRRSGQTTDQLSVGDLLLDRFKRRVVKQDRKIALTSREFNLLECLMQAPSRVFTRTHLLQRVWGFDFDPATNVVDACIKRIRRKIDTAESDSHIESIRGVGYSFRIGKDLGRADVK